MDFAIRLSCILALFFCLAGTGNAATIDQDRQKIQEMLRISAQNTDPDAQLRITYETVEIYKKYRGLEKSDAAIESELDAKVKEFEYKIEPVEGIGGGLFKIILPEVAKSSKANKRLVVEIGNYFLCSIC